MAQVDPNAVAEAAIADIQGAINGLSAMMADPAADIAGINQKIDDLTGKQADLRVQELHTIEGTAETKQAIADMNNAADALKTEAAMIGQVATALTDAASVVATATTLVTALAAFV